LGKRLWLQALVVSGFCFGCEPDAAETLGKASERVESSQLGHSFDVAFDAAPTLAALKAAQPQQSASDLAKAFVRGLSMQGAPYWASGSLTIPALTAAGGTQVMAPPPATSRIRYSCGVTLISPSYAITAGHCPTSDTKLDELKLQMYRPTRKLASTWTKTEALSGAWPLMHHPKLDAADGYLLDEYACTLALRCYGGDSLSCDNSGGDVALLKCDGRPGDKYGFLNVATAASTGKEALIQWKHEVLDINGVDPVPTDYVDHYVTYDASKAADNFHYFESENQLLPLRTVVWPGLVSPIWLSATGADVYGCHGTSGSGMLARQGDSPEYRLVGPVALGGAGFGNVLCQHVPNTLGPQQTGPGIVGMSVNFNNPQLLLNDYAAPLDTDCKARKVSERDVDGLPFLPGSHRPSTLFSHLACQLDGFAHDGSVPADAVFGPYPERFVDDAAPTERVIHGFEVEAQADYRVALQAQSTAACVNCALPQLRIGADAADAAVTLVAERTLLTRTFTASSTGPLEIGVKNAGSKLALGGFTLLREGQINSFDVPEDRLEAALYALNDAGAVLVGPAPMRFVGDGKAGFQALLFRGERLALLRQALGPGQRWTVRLGSPSYDDLTCGLLDLNGAPATTTPCASVFPLDDHAGNEPRLGFFVELAANSTRESADITFVALASGKASDPDQDGVPDVLDNCPGDWNAAQGDCAEEPPVVVGGGGGEGGVGGDPSAGGASDAGASTEAGSSANQAGNTNGGSGATSGTSAGGNPATAGTSTDGGTATGGSTTTGGSSTTTGGELTTTPASPKDSSGCSCNLPGHANGSAGPFALAALGLASTLKRRRTARGNVAPSRPCPARAHRQ
jgi:hypothetical protein